MCLKVQEDLKYMQMSAFYNQSTEIYLRSKINCYLHFWSHKNSLFVSVIE